MGYAICAMPPTANAGQYTTLMVNRCCSGFLGTFNLFKQCCSCDFLSIVSRAATNNQLLNNVIEVIERLIETVASQHPYH